MVFPMGQSLVVKTGDVVEGRYRIIKTLGGSSLGTVFLAEHVSIKRRVAIKILNPQQATNADLVQQFMSEARAASSLGHPNIVDATDMGLTSEHVPYVVFEYLEGTLLTDEVYRVGGLPLRRVVKIAQQIASAMHAAHESGGLVHRALHSDNVFLTDRDNSLDHVKILDFGSARLRPGAQEYMAPEQLGAQATADKRADIYALGVIMYEMLTARRPFSNDEDDAALSHRIANTPPPPLQRSEVPPAMAEMILNKLLAKDPAARFQTMAEVEAALDQFTMEASKAVRRPSSPPENVQDVARNSDLIPRPVQMLDTPWPPMQVVTLPQPAAPAKKPFLLYGIAAVGLLVGGAGLAVGLRGGGSGNQQTAATTPVTPPAPLPAVATQAPRDVQPAQKIQVELSANVPNARVTFRRRVAAAPATMQISSSDIVELVEISAPGYKTTRYWLTFDRPTKLVAKLVKGNGLEEASEEATLIALGEVAPPATPAVAVAAPAPAPAPAPAIAAVAVAKTVAPAPSPIAAAAPERVTPPVVRVAEPAPVVAETPAPRKIGRIAAEESVAMAEEPKAEPAAIPAPAPEPVKPEPVAVVEAPKPEPVKAEPVPEPEVVKPAIDRATVSSVIGQHRPEVLKCISEGKKKSSSMKGTITLQLQVDASGKVRAQVQSTLNNPLVAACVIRAANGWRFPSRSDGQMASVAYPFTIN